MPRQLRADKILGDLPAILLSALDEMAAPPGPAPGFAGAILAPVTTTAFTDDEAALLADIDREVEWVTIGKGDSLVRQGDPSDSVYVVLHGRLRALAEAGIPVDAVGGTSAGALMAAMCALDWSAETLRYHARHLFVELNVLGDYTVPIVSLIAGRRFTDAMRELFGEARIEDLRRPFFAVASNLTRGEQVILRDSLICRAIRATCAIPGIMPPRPSTTATCWSTAPCSTTSRPT